MSHEVLALVRKKERKWRLVCGCGAILRAPDAIACNRKHELHVMAEYNAEQFGR